MQGERPAWYAGKRDWSEREVLLALACTPGVLPARVASKLAAGHAPTALLTSRSPDPQRAAQVLDRVGVRFAVSSDAHWPLPPGEPDPPCAWLFVRGQVPSAPSASVAIVGSRQASRPRQELARRLGSELAEAGWHVVSGAAVGIDGWAHRGSMDPQGAPGGLAVLGCGPDVVYPREHAELLRRLLVVNGGIVSEHPPGTPPLAAHFLARNRLIAALATAVVVVAAGVRSGSLATARLAAERGHGHVLVVPGGPWEEDARGCNALIRDGALLVTTAAEVLEVIGEGAGTRRTRPGVSPSWSAPDVAQAPGVAEPPSVARVQGGGLVAEEGSIAPPRAFGEVAQRVTQLLAAYGPQSAGVLAERVGAPAPALTRALVELELAGRVRRAGSLLEVVDAPCMR